MIYDDIKNVERYLGISKNLDTAIYFLMNNDLNALKDGRSDIDGNHVFINICHCDARKEDEVQYEFHKRYMDIQIDLEGTEMILTGEPIKEVSYNNETDFGVVESREVCRTVLGPSKFIVLLGDEPHKPSLMYQKESIALRKAVIKVEI